MVRNPRIRIISARGVYLKAPGNNGLSLNPSMRAQRSNPFLLTNQALMDRRVAALLAKTELSRSSLENFGKKIQN
jgi:hypothetical protein